MQFKEKIKLTLSCIRVIAEKWPNTNTYGTPISTIKMVFVGMYHTPLLDSDIKYLFDKSYIESWYTHPGDTFIYTCNLDYLVRISTKGIDYLEEEKVKKALPPQNIQYIQGLITNVTNSGNVYSQINISNVFTQVYNTIEQEIKNKTEVKELIKEVKDIEEELKRNNFEKVKEKLSHLCKKAKFLLPILQQIITEVFKNWLLIH